MQYKYRWWYGVASAAVVFLISGFCWLYPALNKLLAAKQTEKQLQSELVMVKQQTSVQNAVRKSQKASSVFFSFLDLPLLAHQSGVTIQSMKKVENNAFAGVEVLHGVLQGDLKAMSRWLTLLFRQNYPMGLLDFSLKTIALNQYLFEADIIIVNAPLLHDNRAPPDLLMHDSFCKAAFVTVDEAKQMQVAPLQLIKMIGFMQAGNHIEAWLKLPDNQTLTVTKGVEIGKEKGRVKTILKDRLIVELAHGQSYEITS